MVFFTFCGVEFKVEPFDRFSFKMLLGETLCNFSQLFPPKNLLTKKYRRLKYACANFFFSLKLKINYLCTMKYIIERIKTQLFIHVCLLFQWKMILFQKKKNGACVLGTPYFSKCHLSEKVKVHSGGKNFRAFSLFS